MYLQTASRWGKLWKILVCPNDTPTQESPFFNEDYFGAGFSASLLPISL
jgi:hypothetical protein